MAKERILLTGASGFIGQALAEKFIAAGYSVRALYRRPDAPARLKKLASKSLELFRGDLSEPLTISAIVEGCDVVVHVAALASDWGKIELFREQNVEATRRLAEAAQAWGAKRFVFISSASIQGFGDPKKGHVDSTEAGPYFPLRYPYPISKKEAEDLVLSMNSEGFTTIAIRPANVYGPGDSTSTYPMFDQVEKGVFGWIAGGRALTCPVYIDDLCAAVLAACSKAGLGGKAIIVSDGEKVSWRDYVMRMYEVAQKKTKPLGLPGWTASFAAAFLKLIWVLFRLKASPPLTGYLMDQARSDYHFSPALAKELLGFVPKVFYREGLERTYKAWKRDRVPS